MESYLTKERFHGGNMVFTKCSEHFCVRTERIFQKCLGTPSGHREATHPAKIGKLTGHKLVIAPNILR